MNEAIGRGSVYSRGPNFLDMEARWLSLARNYEFAELSRVTRGRRRLPRPSATSVR
jgi:hypothetical protein